MHDAIWWAGINLLTIIIMAYFSSIEMACVSFNKVRLQYYLSKGHKIAGWIHYMTQHPSRLFGTTLIGVNVTMMIGSECSRQMYSSLGLNPALAPLSQVLIVVTVGELAPLFAARRHPEHTSMLGIPILYFTAKLMTPVLISFHWLTVGVSRLFGRKGAEDAVIYTREELQKIIEEDHTQPQDNEDYDIIVSNIFKIRGKKAKEVMQPLSSIQMIPSNCTITHMRRILESSPYFYLPLYHRQPSNIVGIAFARDLIRLPDSRRVRDFCKPPWFITQEIQIIQVLEQFRENHQSVAIVLNQHGQAVGLLTLEAILEEIFGKAPQDSFKARSVDTVSVTREFIERTVEGQMLVKDFCAEFNVTIEDKPEATIAQALEKLLGHSPEEGESITIEGLELTVSETGILGPKSIEVKTRSE